MTQKQSRLKTIDVAYFIGTILVLLGHSHPVAETYVPLAIKDITDFIYLFHIPLFFFISGILLNYTRNPDFNVPQKSFSRWIRGKACSLLIPYFVLSLLGIIP